MDLELPFSGAGTLPPLRMRPHATALASGRRRQGSLHDRTGSAATGHAVDGLTGFPEAIEAIFPKTTLQTCIVRLVRSSLRHVPREREQVARDLKPIHTAKDADQGRA